MDGKFYTKSGSTYTQVGTNNSYTATNANAQDIYYVGEGVVSVRPVKNDGTDDLNLNTPDCNKSVTITSDIGYCTNLESKPVESSYTQIGTETVYLHTLKTMEFDTSNHLLFPFNVGLKWTTTNPNGKFYTKPGSTYTLKGNIAVGTMASGIYYKGNFGDTVTAKLIKMNDTFTVEVFPTSQEQLQLNQSVCSTTFTIQAEPNGVCSNLDITHSHSEDILATINGQKVTVHKFQYSGMSFTQGQHPDPATLALKWHATDPNGRFYKYLASGQYVKLGN